MFSSKTTQWVSFWPTRPWPFIIDLDDGKHGFSNILTETVNIWQLLTAVDKYWGIIRDIYTCCTYWYRQRLWLFDKNWQIFSDIYNRCTYWYLYAGEPSVHQELPARQDTSGIIGMSSKRYWQRCNMSEEILQNRNIDKSYHSKLIVAHPEHMLILIIQI